MNKLTARFSVVMFCVCTGCGVFSGDANESMATPEVTPHESVMPAPAPGGETAPDAEVVSGPYSHLPQRESFVPTADVELEEGCYAGDLVLEDARRRVRGAGIYETVIDGDLIVASRCVVTNLTVTGDVIFTGNGARIVGVKCNGQVLDYGMQNQH